MVAYPQLYTGRRSRREAKLDARPKATESLVARIVREAAKEDPELVGKMGQTEGLRQAINILYEKHVKGNPRPRGKIENLGSGPRWLVQTASEKDLDRFLEQGYDIVMRLEDGRYKLTKRIA